MAWPDGRDQDRLRGPRRSVTVTGEGTASGVPDVVVAELGTEAVSPDVQAALDAATSGLVALRDALTAAGVDAVDIRTSQTSTWTERAVPAPVASLRSAPQLESASRTTAQATLRVVLRDAAGAGAVVRDALAAAGSVARLESLSTALSDVGPLAQQAREAAFLDARARAEQYAGLAGKTLGDVLDVREESGPGAPAPRALKASAAMVLEPGQHEVKASVTVRWAFAD
ncbi:putative conserved lipoprotein LpqG [Luteimicrobium album]|uniref:Conserved lipoprotein LpqG n=1 Tax=Luteimicrobium album TaxID=1054550 RepID=A0ABQ6I3X9_9MICO|nr:SIMPL domain-containing protein [Luteimicrobium album]GMA24858.1 putative conserved lipoprotein LpqG [Luteimicrobium album]